MYLNVCTCSVTHSLLRLLQLVWWNGKIYTHTRARSLQASFERQSKSPYTHTHSRLASTHTRVPLAPNTRRSSQSSPTNQGCDVRQFAPTLRKKLSNIETGSHWRIVRDAVRMCAVWQACDCVCQCWEKTSACVCVCARGEIESEAPRKCSEFTLKCLLLVETN